jgi:hypothetical protein
MAMARIQAEQISVSPETGIALDGCSLSGFLDLGNDNGRWMLWRHAKGYAPRARCVSAVIDNPDALKRIVCKMLDEIGIKTLADLQGKIARKEPVYG